MAIAGLAAVLAGGGSSGSGRQPLTIAPGPADRACVTAHARARVTVRSQIVVTARVEQPLQASESASGPAGTAVVTQSEVVSASATASRPVAIQQTSVASARACASGPTRTAARARALQSAYRAALAAAESQARVSGRGTLRDEMNRLYPSVTAAARSRAAARAHTLTLRAMPGLERSARARALKRAGG